MCQHCKGSSTYIETVIFGCCVFGLYHSSVEPGWSMLFSAKIREKLTSLMVRAQHDRINVIT